MNILMCYCMFIHFDAYSIAVWAVFEAGEFMSHIYLLVSERPGLHVCVKFCENLELQ
jgi:hypothetical protein